MDENIIKVILVIIPDGIDFYYAQKQDARRLVDFLQTVVPCRYLIVWFHNHWSVIGQELLLIKYC